MSDQGSIQGLETEKRAHENLQDNMEALLVKWHQTYWACLDALAAPDTRRFEKVGDSDLKDALEEMGRQMDVNIRQEQEDWRNARQALEIPNKESEFDV